ncbi:MAG: UDP-N-acetylmuramoyl-L-alanyl-D-glutamate--2,6-diaminopimelate ligase [Bacteroidetes bacterium]|nr:UDP-N-acetylmuramoyl-L-alanyl-D-glutamate--2,6-diaminopimelate ligase [Bacteroidota bacterium]
MPVLRDILKRVEVQHIEGNVDVAINGLCIDSRKVSEGNAFIAIKGVVTDGYQYIDKAISLGAKAIVCEQIPQNLAADVVYVIVANASIAVGEMASLYFGEPSAKLKVVGVTGTNGKTTVATLLYQLFSALGYRCALLSTVQNHIGDRVIAATHTTPDAISIQAFLCDALTARCTHVFMEVSSHAIHQQRIAGILFTGGIFTNITHDHLDYHKTFEEYIRVKKKFFDDLPKSAFALSNSDDRRGNIMLQNCDASRNTYSLKSPASFKGKVLENNLSGLVMNVDGSEVHMRMIGTFNAYNLLAVYGTSLLLGENKMEVLSVLSGLIGAPGRFETQMSLNEHILGIVDYAHTPDALLNVLATINQLRIGGQQLITVVGCGGDRDTTKRPEMAEVAVEQSDRTILTSDNPRSENPETILDQMEAGLSTIQKRKMLRISNRKEAIKTACTLANAGDIILIAGKGHETYQEMNGVRHHFDDREILKQTFELLNK